MQETDTYKSKPYTNFIIFIILCLFGTDAIFNMPLLGAIGLFIAATLSIVETLNAYRSNKPYGKFLGQMEVRHGRKATTLFFIFLAAIGLVLAVLKGLASLEII